MSPPVKPELPAAAASGSSTLQDPRVADMSSDEMDAALLAAARSAPRGSSSAPASGQGTPSATPAPEPQVPGFWHNLLNSAKTFVGLNGQKANDAQDIEILRSIPRGLAGAGNEMAHTVFEGGAALARVTGLGEFITPGYNQAYDDAGGARNFVQDEANADQQQTDQFYGPQSTDPIASFTESTTQFLAGMAVARSVGIKNVFAQGAASDFAFMDPYKAQLAELAAKAPNWTGIGLLGKLGSVQNDHLDKDGNLVRGDGALVARIKRMAAGTVAAGLVEGLIGAARFFRSTSVLASSSATPAEKAAAQQVAQESATAVQNAAEGPTAGQPVTVEPTPDGRFGLKVNTEGDWLDKVYGQKAGVVRQIRDLANQARDISLRIGPDGKALGTPMTAEDAARVTELRAQAQALRDANPDLNMQSPPKAQSGGVQPKAPATEPSGINPNDIIARERARYPVTDASTPTFATQGEALAQAEVMNDGVNARLTRFAGEVTPEDAAAVRDIAKAYAETDDPVKLQELQDGTHFNFSYANEPPEALAYIEALSKHFQTELDNAQATVPIARTMQMVKDIVGAMPEGDAPGLAQQMLQGGTGSSAFHAKLLAADVVLKRFGKKLADMSSMLDARPNDAVLHEEFRTGLQNMYGLQEELARANSEWGRTGRALQERANPALKQMEFGTRTDAAAPTATPAPNSPAQLVAGMSQSELRAQARMIRLANGEPANMFAVRAGAEVMRLRSMRQIVGDIAAGAQPRGPLVQELKDKMLRSAVEVFTNSLLSAPATLAKVATSQATVGSFEALARMGAGAATWNRALAQEGADQLWGLFKYTGDNIRSMKAALDAGQSLIDPRPQVFAIGGRTGDLVRIPGKAIGALDEFSTIANYRATIRAKSLRLGRAEGLTGAALEDRVNEDLAHAFDAQGRATVPEALQRAKTPSFNGPLQPDSFGAAVTNVVNNNVAAKFILPFTKVGFNVFNYAWENTPLLNLLNKQARQTLLQGGEEASVLNAKTALAGTIYTYAMMKAMQGDLAGRGPSNPALRQQWLATHKPYSVRVTDALGNEQWMSYQKAEPFASLLGVVGDLHQIISEDPGSRSGSDLAMATVSALAADLSSKTYLAGVSDFASAWDSNDPSATKRYLENFVANLVVPRGVTDVSQKLGLSPYMQEVNSMRDAIMARLPSNGLVPRFDFMGRPRLRMIDPSSLPKNNVEDALLGLDKALTPFPPRVMGGLVDLTDKQYADKKQPVPYVRLMDLIRDGFSGNAGMRDQMVNLVNSDRWKEASGGSELFPGGARWMLANAYKSALEQRAFGQVRQEYPRLDRADRAAIQARGQSVRSGDAGVADVEKLFGVSLSK